MCEKEKVGVHTLDGFLYKKAEYDMNTSWKSAELQVGLGLLAFHARLFLSVIERGICSRTKLLCENPILYSRQATIFVSLASPQRNTVHEP